MHSPGEPDHMLEACGQNITPRVLIKIQQWISTTPPGLTGA